MTGRPELRYPAKPKPGDRVAIVSPSWAGPAEFPQLHDLGLRRLRDHYGLEPVEYPTTRVAASPAERAADLHAAFADPGITAVMATIGGSDQLKVLAHLDPDLLRANPKQYYGYSDNTNLLLYLWNLGIVGCHGGSTMVHLGRGGRMHPVTEASLRTALFESGVVELHPSDDFGDDGGGDWADPATYDAEPTMRPGTGWTWHGEARRVTGPSWGGSFEIIDFHLRAGRYLLDNAAYDGCVLLLETSEELPRAGDVRRMLMCMGERGLLGRFAAVVVGAPKAGSWQVGEPLEQRAAYTAEQHDTIVAALDEYNPGVPAVFGVDFGHTDPQLVLPLGGEITVDGADRRLFAKY